MGGKKVVSVETCVMTGERLNSPRSIEACRRAGIEPDELLPKTATDFLNRNSKATLVEKEAAVLRQQHYEQSRQLKLDEVRKERDAILREESGLGGDGGLSPVRSPGGHSSKFATPQRSHSAQLWKQRVSTEEDPAGSMLAITDSTMVQLEEKRLARMKLRQKKEIQCVIEMETKMAKIQQENAKRSADDARRKEEYQKDMRAKRAQLVANKHEREMEKKKQEDRDAVQRKLRAKQEAEKEKLLHEEEARRANERHEEALQREQERDAKAEEFRRQTEALLKQQEDLVAANRQKMLEKERQVLANMEIANRRRHQEAVERREKANARIQQATLQNQLTLQKKKSEFEEKQASAFERAREIQKKTLAELKERSLQQKKEEEIRRKRLDAARDHREKHVNMLVKKRYELEEKLEKAHEEREKHRFLQGVEKTLSVEEKQQNVERIKKKEEYSRLQLLQRISEEDERSRLIKAKKHALMQARQQVATDSMIRKHRIGQAMEHLRKSNKWDKIEETLGTDADAGDARSPRSLGRAGGSGDGSSFMGRGRIDFDS